MLLILLCLLPLLFITNKYMLTILTMISAQLYLVILLNCIFYHSRVDSIPYMIHIGKFNACLTLNIISAYIIRNY